MHLAILNIGMTISIFCFYLGYFYQKRNITLHKILGITGISFTVFTALFLLSIKYLSSGIEGVGIVPIASSWIILLHRAFALLAFVIMLLVGYTGITKNSNLHKKLNLVFLPLYTIVYISGILIFRNK